VHDQLPAIKVNDEFYTISLRMMKAIWRHVRLKKGFENVERAPYGGLKLKIPVTLLAEKLRTQSRFNVRHYAVLLNFSLFLVRSRFFISSLILILPLAGDANVQPPPFALRERAQGLAVRLVQDRQHHKAALPAHAQHANTRKDIISAGRRHAHTAGGGRVPRSACI
jgi:hypothetical protein